MRCWVNRNYLPPHPRKQNPESAALVPYQLSFAVFWQDLIDKVPGLNYQTSFGTRISSLIFNAAMMTFRPSFVK